MPAVAAESYVDMPWNVQFATSEGNDAPCKEVFRRLAGRTGGTHTMRIKPGLEDRLVHLVQLDGGNRDGWAVGVGHCGEFRYGKTIHRTVPFANDYQARKQYTPCVGRTESI